MPILTTLGIANRKDRDGRAIGGNYDDVPSMDKLIFKMKEALQKFQKLWLTLDKDKIYAIIRLCMARELQSVEERKDAAEYALKRPKSFDSWDANADLSAVKSASMGQSSPSRAGSPSPMKKSTRFDGVLKTGGRDLNTTGFELKSIGTNDGRPVSFKEPPMLKNMKSASKDVKPTAANLRRLDSKVS